MAHCRASEGTRMACWRLMKTYSYHSEWHIADTGPCFLSLEYADIQIANAQVTILSSVKTLHAAPERRYIPSMID
jgi:hypothetical protein